MKKLNILFDGNYLLYKTLGVTNNYSAGSSEKYLSDPDDVGILIRKVATDMISTINRFPGFNKVIITKDVKSWRKTFYTLYKAHREKTETVDWNALFNAFDELLEILKSKGIVVSTITGAEGDDLLYLWSDYFLNKNEVSTVIITGDKDLYQLSDYNEDVFTVVYNNNSKLRKFIVREGFANWLAEVKFKKIVQDNHTTSVFDSFDDMFSSDANDIIEEAMLNTEILEVDPNAVSFMKVLCGDDGDNVPAILTWPIQNKKGETVMKRITEKMHSNKVHYALINKYDNFNTYDLTHNKHLIEDVRVILADIAKITIDKKEWAENLNRNLRLVYLHKDMLPENIVEEFPNCVKMLDDFETNITNNIDLLEGTKFAKYKTSGSSQSSVFAALDGTLGRRQKKGKTIPIQKTKKTTTKSAWGI